MSLVDVEQNVVIGASGGGSTALEVYNATQNGKLPRTRIVGVFYTDREAGIKGKAEKFKGLDPDKDVVFLDPTSRSRYGLSIVNYFKDIQERKGHIDLFCQYGLTPFTPGRVIDWLEANESKGINQHGGAVNPDKWDFGGRGMSCPERFIAARIMFVRDTGTDMYQYVVSQALAKEYDAGGVYNRIRVPILDHERVADFKAKAIQFEWAVQIKTLKDFEEGKAEFKSPMDRLVMPNERPLLELVKGIACRLYGPEGDEILHPNFEDLIPKDKPEVRYDIRRLVGHLYPKK